MTSSMQLGNPLSRLQGLKNISGKKKVMPELEFMDEMLPQEPEMGNMPPPEPMYKSRNEPEPDLGGALTPQSYDVRANTVENTEQPQTEMPVAPEPQEKSFFSRLGESLASYMKEQGAPSSYEEFQNKALNQNQYFSPEYAQRQNVQLLPSEEIAPAPQVAQQFPQIVQKNPQLQQQIQQQIQKQAEPVVDQQQFVQDIDQAMQNPWQHAVYGSAETIANSPALQAEFKKITGIDFEPQVQQAVSEMEAAMKGVEDAVQGLYTELDPIKEGIRQRILQNQTTDQDNYLIGMALLLPLIIGGAFGAEAGFKSLGGGLENFADIMQNRQKQKQLDEQQLLDVNKQQASLQKQLADIGGLKGTFEQDVRKNLPQDPRQHLMEMQEISWTDPVSGKQLNGVEILPGLVARGEKVANPKGLERMEKAAQDIADVKTYVDNVNELVSDMAEIIPQLKDPNFVWKAIRTEAAKHDPSLLGQIAQTVMVKGQRVNAGLALQQKMGLLSELHAQAQKLGQLDKAAQTHVQKLLQNPQSSFASPKDALNMLLEIQKITQSTLVNGAYNHGFYPEFLIQKMEEKTNPMFQKLNGRENDKRLNTLLNEAAAHEVNYGK